MKRFINWNEKRQSAVFAAIFMGSLFLLTGYAVGQDSSGVSLAIYDHQDSPDRVFPLGAAVKLILVIKNDTGFPINTGRGFADKEPQRFLVLYDPAGNQHVIGGDVRSGSAPPPFFLGNLTTEPAEILPADWVKSVVIDDLTDLFPVMKETLGWYTLEAHMPFVRFAWAIDNAQLGLLGVVDETHNWNGTLDSNKMQLQIVLGTDQQGAHLKVRVFDQSMQPPIPLNQVAVRVYENDSIAGLSLAEAWALGTGQAVLSGTTDPEGWAVWVEDLCKLKKDYTAIAYYQNEYRAVLFGQGETGWTAQCDGVLEKSIYFGEPPDKIVLVTGSAFNYPESVYIASFAMDISENADLSGWFKYYYTKTRLSFLSTAITEITASGTEAVIKGSGTANGVAGYSFEAYVTDGNPDTFGLIIQEAGGDIYYNASMKNTNGGDLKVTVEVLVAPCEGDFDGDRDVDGKDLNVFRTDYGRTNCSTQACQGDFGGDGDVDVEDLSTFIEDYGRVDCPQKP